jgi:hypothetical protein
MYGAREINNNKREFIMKAYISMSILCLVSMFTMSAYAEPAIIFQGDLCVVVLLPPNAEPIVLEGNKLQATVAVAGRGEFPLQPAKLTCQGRHDFPLEHAILQRQPCFLPETPFGDLFTENGKAVFTPNGNWTAQCMFHDN